MENYHRLLKRQFKNYLTDEHLKDEKLTQFLNCINDAYHSYDSDYKQLEHILELSNKESYKALKDIQFALNQVASVFTINSLGEVQEANDNFYTLTGFKPEGVLNKRYDEVFRKSEDVSKYLLQIKDTFSSAKVWRGEVVIETETGNKLYTNTSIIPIFNETDLIIKYLFISFDISAEKVANENLSRSEEKYKSIISNINLGLLEVDLTETILMVNQSFCEMSGYEADELIGKKTYEIILDSSSFSMLEKKQQLRKDKISDAYEIEVYNKAGDKKYWLISGAPMFNHKGQHIGSIGIHLDISDRKDNEKKMESVLNTLRNVNKELNDFAYIVSHDLKAPLRAIGSLATWLEADYAEKLDIEGRETLKLLVQRTQRMHNLIEGVLNYSKVGRTSENNVVVNTNQLVEKIIDLLPQSSNIKISLENQLPNVFFDEVKLQQIFQNLISNAIKFMDKPMGYIKISSKEKDNYYEFSISDNGPGIKAEHFDKIFQIFQTLKSRDEFESTGVGLSIVKKIIENNGGTISVNSEIENGTTFTFSIKK